jgi:hypothetical protein
MIFGDPTSFAIEIHHEPSAPRWKGFGRMCLHMQGVTIGNPLEAHCSLFHAAERIAEVATHLAEQWDERFAGRSGEEIFAWLDAILYSGKIEASENDVARFDFLTNTGEQFDGFKTFIYCTPDDTVCVLFRSRDDSVRTATCTGTEFRAVVAQLEQWFRTQIAR